MIIPCIMTPERRASPRTQRLLFILLTVFLAAAAVVPAMAAEPSGTAPETVRIGVYVMDFSRVDIAAGTVGADFYLDLTSDPSVSIDDIELMNGMITSVSPMQDTPNEKVYRVIAVLTNEPDLSRYPFDRHTLTLQFEPKLKNEKEMVFVIDNASSGLYPKADIPGWELSAKESFVTNETYSPGEIPYSRAVFQYGVMRDETSTILKFFLPLLLIIIVSLSSLVMKTSSRLGLNASMFLAAVLIHWRIADSVPNVTYATFLDLFMIITYATLVMVLVSGILILKFTDSGDTARVEQINFWSLRLIPPLSIAFYFLLCLTLVL